MVVKRHLIDFLLYLLYIGRTIFLFIVFKDDSYFKCISSIFLCFMGIIIVVTRFSEPFVYQNFISVKSKYSSEPLCAFANSAMNIEFVYLILVGINNFMEIKG